MFEALVEQHHDRMSVINVACSGATMNDMTMKKDKFSQTVH